MTDIQIYSNLLSTTRIRASEVPGRTVITESESDRGRVLFCPAFRRLQQKAQVFSMEPNAAVRSRLTHSLEVSQIGRYLADEVCALLVQNNAISTEQQIAIGNFVETACLIHDIGNPPFGHFGEAAIRKWFEDNGTSCLQKAVTLECGNIGSGDPRLLAALADFKEFDGNPQGLRIVCRLQWNKDRYGLNLTKTTIASFLKYVREAGHPVQGIFTKKAGFFSTERDIIKNVWREFGYSNPQRFPLAYLMEAADDIAYCISDLEDSIEKSLVHESQALEAVSEAFNNSDHNKDSIHNNISDFLNSAKRGQTTDGSQFTYVDFRTSLNRVIVNYVAKRFVDKHSEILNGTLDSLLPATEAPGSVLAALKNYCRENVYRHETVQRTELAGYTAIHGLLTHFEPLLAASRERFNCALKFSTKDTEKKLLSLNQSSLAYSRKNT